MTSLRRVGLPAVLLLAAVEGEPVVTWYVGASGASCKATCEGLNQHCVPARALWPINASGMAFAAHRARHVCHNYKVLDQAFPTFAPAMRSVPVWAAGAIPDPSLEPIRYETTCYFAKEASIGQDPCWIVPNDPLRHPLETPPGALDASVTQPETWSQLNQIPDITLLASAGPNSASVEFFHRFCPCTAYDVKWRIGQPGDSCSETCGKSGGICGFSTKNLETDTETFKKVLTKHLKSTYVGGATMCKSYLPRTSDAAPFIRGGVCSLSAMNVDVVPNTIEVMPLCDARVNDGMTMRFCPCYGSPSL